MAAKLSEDVLKGDIDAIHASLFSVASSNQVQRPPVLVNQLDGRGWGLMHHCTTAEEPSLDVLMALYLAGADLSLPTSFERYTPLHCLVKAKRSPTPEALHKLLGFVVHLVRDLNAPLTVQDRNQETPLHIAAEHGTCLEVLAFLLELDKNGAAKEIRNARGSVVSPASPPGLGPPTKLLILCDWSILMPLLLQTYRFRSCSTRVPSRVRPGGRTTPLLVLPVHLDDQAPCVSRSGKSWLKGCVCSPNDGGDELGCD